MRTSLVIFGVIFLVIGIALYLVPMQVIKANTTTIGNGGADTRTSSASVTVPIIWAFASAIIGLVLLILGLVIPGPNRGNNPKKDTYDTVVKSKEDIKVGDGNARRIKKERTEKYNRRKGEDEDLD